MTGTTMLGAVRKVRGALLLLALAATACGGGGSGSGSSIAATTEVPATTEDKLTVTIFNDQLDPIRTWLLVEGQRVRLGQVQSNGSETFYYSIPGIRQVRLEFDISLGRRCVTVDRALGPGESIEVRIPIQLTAFPGVCR
jgi:multidrug efflux pump subunit AcrA (membrane-fusion protein)